MPELFKLVIKQTGIYSLGSILSGAAGVLLLPLLTRNLDPGEYGRLVIFLGLISLFTILGPMGIGSSLFISYFHSPQEDQRRRLVASAQAFLALSGLALGTLVGLGAPFLSRVFFGGPDYTRHFWVMGGVVFFETALLLPLALFRVLELPGRYVAVSLGKWTLTIGLVALFLLRTGLGLLGVLLAYLLAGMGTWLVTLPAVTWRYGWRPQASSLVELLRLGVPLMGATLLSWVMALSDRYVLGFFRSFEEVGIYDVGYLIAKVISIGIVAPFNTAWATLMFRVAEREDQGDAFAMLLTCFYALLCLGSVVVSLFAPELIVLLASREYLGATRVVPLVAGSYVLAGLYTFWTFGPALRNRTTDYPVVLAGAALLNLAANLVLIPSWGMMGAAVATLLGYAVMAGLMYRVSNRMAFVPYDYPGLAVITAATVTVLVLNSIWAAPGWLSTVLRLMALAAFGVGLAFLIVRKSSRRVRREPLEDQVAGWERVGQ